MKQRKKISNKDWTYIGRYNYAAKWLRPLCSYSLVKENDNMFRREQKVGWPLYLILFIPVHILQVFWCLWDGGLKEFEVNKRYLGSDTLMSGSECFTRAVEIWNAHIK